MSKIRILFVDDEEVSRERFLSLAEWEEPVYELAGICKDGEDALRCLEEKAVDILITDINMPFLDGIELLERVKRDYPHIRVLLLTGYEYFEYARKAIELKAFDFLLKPITAQRLKSAVEKAVYDIEKERADKQAAGRGRELAQSEFINRLLCGKIAQEDVYSEAAEVEIATEGCNYAVLIMAVDREEGGTISDSEASVMKADLRREIRKLHEEEKRKKKIPSSIYFSRGVSAHIKFLISLPQEISGQEEYVDSFAQALLALKPAGMIVTVGMGKMISCLTEIPESFKKVEFALTNRHILGLGRVIYDQDAILKRDTPESVVLPTEIFLYHIRMGMTEEVRKDIVEIYKKLRQDNAYISLESAKMVTVELAITAFKANISPDGESVSYLYYLNHIQQLNTLDELERDITKFAVNVAESRRGSGNHKKIMAEQALRYLRQNYQKEELSLNDVAGALNISVPYLAVLFKQETGKNFGTHLLEIRMEKAKELLRTTEQMVAEISEAVGYASP